MSLLDNVFNGVGTDPAVITDLQTKVTAAQVLIAAQQSAITALTATVTANDNAQTALDAIQQAAIDAQTALNTAQQAAITATQAVDATQGAVITALKSRIPWGVGLDVRAYTALDSNGLNVALTNANFQDALEAAIADAYSRVPVTAPAGVNITGAYYVSIPEGYWTVSRQIHFPGTHYVKQTPGLRGAGMGRTTLLPAPGFDVSTYSSVIYIGSDLDADTSYTKDFYLADLTIQGSGHRCNAVHVRTAYGAVIERVRASNFQAPGLSPRLGWGFVFDDAYEDTEGTRPNQHVMLYDCYSEQNQGGYYFRDGGPFVLTNCYANQNYWRDCVCDQVRLTWHGGTMQTTGYSPDNYWYGNNPNGTANLTLGWNHIVRQGTGATLQAASGGRCGVIGLTGLDNAGGTDRYRWLELRRATNPYAADDQISGMYLIDELYNDTACWIRKTTTHAETSGLNWYLRDSAASDIVLTGEIYHEGAVPSLVLLPKVYNGRGDPNVTVNGVINANAATVVESRAYDARLTLMDVRQCAHMAIASHAVQVTATQATPDMFTLDEYSREGLVCRAPAPGPFTEPGTDAFFSSGHLYMGSTRVNRRLTSLAKECGAVAILDARVASSLTLSGTDITAWASRVGGIATVPLVASNYPTYIATDAVFGTPSVQLTGAAGASNKGLKLTIPAASMPTIRHQMSVVVVYRLPDTTAAPTGQVRRVLLSTPTASHSAGFNEIDHAGPVCYGGAGVADPGGSMFAAPGSADTLAHCACFGSAGRMRLCIDTDQTRVRAPGWEEYDAPGGLAFPASTDHTLYLNATTVATTTTLIVAFVAVIPRGLSWQERQQFLDAAAVELRVANR